MSDFLRLFGKTAVALAVLLHMGAVLAFSVPSDARDPLGRFLFGAVRPRIAPYVLVTSQWQEWNLFAPDPLRRIRSFTMEREEGTGWKTVAALGPDTFPWWRHATYAKLLPALLMKERLDYDVLRERFAQVLCHDLGVAPGSMVRLREHETVIPYVESHRDIAWWRSWRPSPVSTVIHVTHCNPSSL